MILSKQKTGIIIQARMGSTRLPEKIMMPIKNKPIFDYQLKRLGTLSYPVFIATTTKSSDDIVEKFAEERGLPCFRGDENNVLSRYYHCAKEHKLENIVRLTSDCPLIDADIIEQGISMYFAQNDVNTYVSNTLDRTYPRGADFEVFSFKQLEIAFEQAVDPVDQEHVTPYIWKNKSGMTKVVQIKNVEDFSAFRLTLDTREDLKLISKLIEQYNADRLSMDEICAILTLYPELSAINHHIEQKKV